MNKRKLNCNSKNSGITLIALVITIIVIMILAAVSLNITFGDNGVISKAQKTNYTQSVAVLQEYLNSFYVENYNDLQGSDDKAFAMANYSKSNDWFFKTVNGYVVDENGIMHVFIVPENLPDEIKSQITGGTSTEKSYDDYRKGTDVYGVTSDLKVYYSKSNFENMLGVSYDELESENSNRITINDENPDRVIFDENSSWSKLVNGDSSKSITVQEIKEITTLEINENSEITSFSKLYNFTSLKKLTISNVEISLAGLENVPDLKYLYLKNAKITDFSTLKKLVNLEYLYVERNGNTAEADMNQINNMLDVMASSNYSKLAYFGIFGYNQLEYFYGENSQTYNKSKVSQVSDLSKFKNLSDTTKKAIKYLYLNNNKIADLSPIEDCINVEILRIEVNNFSNLNGISKMSKLSKLVVAETQLNDISVLGTNNCKNITFLNLVSNSNLTTINYLNNLTNVTNCFLKECANFSTSEVESIADWYNGIRYKSIDAEYTDYLQGTTQRVYENKNLTDTSEQITDLENMTAEAKAKIKKITLSGSSSLSDEKLNNVLSSGFINCEALDLTGCSNLTSLDFLSNMTNLKEILLNDTGITGNEVSKLDTYCENLNCLEINTNIDLTVMQKTISRIWKKTTSSYGKYNYGGLRIPSGLVPQLENCTDITYFTTYGMESYTTSVVDLSNCTKLTSISILTVSTKFKLPSSVETISTQNGKIPDVTNCANTLQKMSNNQCKDNFTSADFTELCKTLANSTSFKTFSATPIGDFDFSGLNYLNGSAIESITISRNATYSGSLNNLQKLDFRKPDSYVEGTKHFYNLKTISLDYSGITSLEAFKDCSALTTLTITNANITNTSQLENLTNLKSVNLINNKITNLYGLRNCVNLETLNLTNNSVYNSIYDSSLSNYVNNVDIIKTLNGKHLKNIYLSNNKLEDISELQKLNWSNSQW